VVICHFLKVIFIQNTSLPEKFLTLAHFFEEAVYRSY